MISHIATIRTGGAVVGFQLRYPEGSKYFAVKKLGGTKEAHDAAHLAADAMGLSLRKQIRFGFEGIRWRWMKGALGQYLYVITHFTDKEGRRHVTGYSTEKHGLAGALDLAIFAREMGGATVPGMRRNAILAALQAEYETRAH